MPVLGALKAERGKVGRDFGPFLRAPTPGEMGGLGRLAIRDATVATCHHLSFKYPMVKWLSHVYTACSSAKHRNVMVCVAKPEKTCGKGFDVWFLLICENG